MGGHGLVSYAYSEIVSETATTVQQYKQHRSSRQRAKTTLVYRESCSDARLHARPDMLAKIASCRCTGARSISKLRWNCQAQAHDRLARRYSVFKEEDLTLEISVVHTSAYLSKTGRLAVSTLHLPDACPLPRLWSETNPLPTSIVERTLIGTAGTGTARKINNLRPWQDDVQKHFNDRSRSR